MKQKNATASPIFDYRALRLVVGIIAIFLAPTVVYVSSTELPSISASYHTNSRDVFVGLLFFVSAFLWAYNGHFLREKIASKIGAACASGVALFPTDKALECAAETSTSLAGIMHYVSAVAMFFILAYFCMGPFRRKIKGRGGKKGLRSKIYLTCGSIIILSMAGYGIVRLATSSCFVMEYGLLFWVEAISLLFFGVAWIVAGKATKWIVDEDESKLSLF